MSHEAKNGNGIDRKASTEDGINIGIAEDQNSILNFLTSITTDDQIHLDEQYNEGYTLGIREESVTDNALLLYKRDEFPINDRKEKKEEAKGPERDAKTGSNKRICRFCKKQFSHTGSYGRHLDNKKGDLLHPIQQIDAIRGKVVRRNGIVDENKIAQRRTRKRIASRLYNKQEAVKEKNRLRRKRRDKDIKARIDAFEWLLHQFGSQCSSEDAFVDMVCLHVPIRKWPLEDIPCLTTLDELLQVLMSHDPLLQAKAKSDYQVWDSLLPESKKKSWLAACKKHLSKSLGSFTLYNLQHMNQLVDQEKTRRLEITLSSEHQDSASPEYSPGMAYSLQDDKPGNNIPPINISNEPNNFFENG